MEVGDGGGGWGHGKVKVKVGQALEGGQGLGGVKELLGGQALSDLKVGQGRVKAKVGQGWVVVKGSRWVSVWIEVKTKVGQG